MACCLLAPLCLLPSWGPRWWVPWPPPPIAANEPILGLILEQVAIFHTVIVTHSPTSITRCHHLIHAPSLSHACWTLFSISRSKPHRHLHCDGWCLHSDDRVWSPRICSTIATQCGRETENKYYTCQVFYGHAFAT